MPMRRMNPEQFFGRLATLDEQQLKKALWISTGVVQPRCGTH